MKANEKQEIKRLGKKDSSILLPEKTLEEIVVEMIQYVLDKEVYSPPYIAWLSKGQLRWGYRRAKKKRTNSNVHWEDAPWHLQRGIQNHMGIRKPSQPDLDSWNRDFGYFPEWPPERVQKLVSLVKSEFINKKATGKKLDPIEFLYGKGYIDPKTGKRDPNYSSGISGYFFMHKNPEYRQEQVQWLEKSDITIRAQYSLCCSTFVSTVQQQITSGRNKRNINQYLLDQTTYKEIESSMKERKMLPSPEELE